MLVVKRVVVISSLMFRSFFLNTDLLPRRQIPTALHSPIDNFCLIQVITSLYGLFCLLAIISASLEINFVHSRPMPPVAEKIKGVKEPCSTSKTRWLYARFFSRSLDSKHFLRSWEICRFASGLKTLMSKNADWPVCQKPLAWMSKRASSPVIALTSWRSSPVRGWRAGSITTSLQIVLSISAMVFRSSLCRSDTNPPFLQDRACCKSNGRIECARVNL